jgi:UDP-N-acetylglucosamine--N-acetylmuramyl-(pentapeptide) pyrophosphoryl-undecaprenol N-acetylglucosamine transferase
VSAIGAMAAGAAQAAVILSRLNASAIVGFGGYPSVAPVLASRLLTRRPAIILHEQNAVLGRANRFLARFADVLAVSFDATQRVPPHVTTHVTGNPVRQVILQLADTAYEPPTGEIRLLVLGGSLGARVLSDVVPPAITALPPDLRARLRLVQQCRAEDLERVRAAYAAANITAELAPFFPGVAAHLAAAHLVIARAGASSVAEIAVAGRPSILVPLPNAIDDHQAANAAALQKSGGAIVITQRDLTPHVLADRIRDLLNTPQTLLHAAQAARSIARPDAAARLAGLVEDLMRQEART